MDALHAIQIIEGLDDETHTEDETIAAWQSLVDSGIVWQLQGAYGRVAIGMINAGILTRHPKTE